MANKTFEEKCKEYDERKDIHYYVWTPLSKSRWQKTERPCFLTRKTYTMSGYMVALEKIISEFSGQNQNPNTNQKV